MRDPLATRTDCDDGKVPGKEGQSLEEQMDQLLGILIEQQYGGDKKLKEYLGKEIRNLAVRMGNIRKSAKKY